MAYSTDIKDYYRRAWGLEDRPKSQKYAGHYGGTWADWASNYEDQMTFEEYLQDDNIVKKLHALDKKATVVIGSTFPENVSYPDDKNLDILDMGEGKRVYSVSYKSRFSRSRR